MTVQLLVNEQFYTIGYRESMGILHFLILGRLVAHNSKGAM